MPIISIRPKKKLSPDGRGDPFVPVFGTKDRNAQREIARKKEIPNSKKSLNFPQHNNNKFQKAL